MKALLQATRQRFATSFELLAAFWNGPFWWLVPAVMMLLLASVVFVLLQGVPVIAPFVYALF